MVVPVIPLLVGGVSVAGGWLYKRTLDTRVAVAREESEQERQDTRQSQIIATAPEYAQPALRGATTASPKGIDWEKIIIGIAIVAGAALTIYGVVKK